MKKIKFREIDIPVYNIKVILGKDAEGNDKLMKKFKGKKNVIIHTSSPGSPFGVVEKLKPTEDEIYVAGATVAGYSQDWRDNKKDVSVDVFTGKDISKNKGMKPGTWEVKKSRKMKIDKWSIMRMIKNA